MEPITPNTSAVTEDHIKEQLSRRYIEFIANRRGYACLNPTVDYGVDLEFTGFVSRVEAGHRRYMQSDKRIDIQLKCTTCERVTWSDTHLSYPLARSNYNDLVYRREGITPLLLVLVVLPADREEWLSVSVDQLIFKQCGYWYLPEHDATLLDRETKRTIRIPRANVITLDFFAERFTAHYGTAA